MKNCVSISTRIALLVILIIGCLCTTACNNPVPSVITATTSGLTSIATATPTIKAAVATTKPTTKATARSSTSQYSSSSSFTNKYGTRTTKCAISGCNNYIATSGDTNCCTTHSRKCLECRKYIDSDAMYCMDCIRKAFGK